MVNTLNQVHFKYRFKLPILIHLFLLQYGYTCDEVEEMLVDHSLLRDALRDVKYMYGEDIYEGCYGGVF